MAAPCAPSRASRRTPPRGACTFSIGRLVRLRVAHVPVHVPGRGRAAALARTAGRLEERAFELGELNPYNETPTLVDRDLVIYGAQIINEYLEERLPHPPLMPVDPVNRARARLIMMRFERERVRVYGRSAASRRSMSNEQIKDLRDGLIAMSPTLAEQSYMLGEEFTLVDCTVAPFLWRLPVMGIDLPHQAKPVLEYATRLFDRPAFRSSLTEAEKQMRRP